MGQQKNQAVGTWLPRIPNSRPPAQSRVLLGTDGISDGGPHANDVVATEFVGVIQDVVEVGLRAEKKVSPYVVADAAANIDQEVVAAGVIVAGETVGAIRQIESSGLPTDAGHEVRADFLADARLVHAVEIKQNRAERLTTGSAISSLTPFPTTLKGEADAFVEYDIRAHAGIKASLFGTDARGRVARPRRHNGAAAEHGI